MNVRVKNEIMLKNINYSKLKLGAKKYLNKLRSKIKKKKFCKLTFLYI